MASKALWTRVRLTHFESIPKLKRTACCEEGPLLILTQDCPRVAYVPSAVWVVHCLNLGRPTKGLMQSTLLRIRSYLHSFFQKSPIVKSTSPGRKMRVKGCKRFQMRSKPKLVPSHTTMVRSKAGLSVLGKHSTSIAHLWICNSSNQIDVFRMWMISFKNLVLWRRFARSRFEWGFELFALWQNQRHTFVEYQVPQFCSYNCLSLPLHGEMGGDGASRVSLIKFGLRI